jgi:hypothetical protein
MTVAVWVKMEEDFGIDGIKPKLKINYDNGSEVSTEALDTDDWQILSVTFEPQTTF